MALTVSFRNVADFLGDVVEGFKNVPFAKAMATASPWIEAAGDTVATALPPVKFALSLLSKITTVRYPNELAELAFTLSYEHALVQAIQVFGEPKQRSSKSKDLLKDMRAAAQAVPSTARDFSRLSYDDLLLHPFIEWADLIVDGVLDRVGYIESERRVILGEIHHRFVTHFKTLISHGDTREKFEPLRDHLAIGTNERSATAALLEHAQYQRALFEERPVFGKEVFALRHVYIDTECGVLPWSEIRDNGLDPFKEKSGGRHRLGATVLQYLSNPKFNDAIVVQGVAGAGKSAFTQWLSAELIRMGLRPVRILLRDVRLDRTRPVSEALAEAIRYDDETQRASPGYPRPDDAFNRGAIFRERARLGDAVISPYVLILDGWDEISISVSEGFKVRLDRMMENIRTEFLQDREVRIRVILTGRPSVDVANSPLLRKNTPVLTLRPLNPDDLQTFIGKLATCIAEPPLHNAPGTDWPPFESERFDSVLKTYGDDFAKLSEENADARKMEVFGLPLLALLAVRLLSEPNAEPDEIVSSPTLLYRNLVDLTCGGAGKSVHSDEPVEQQEQFRLIGGRLRDLLRRTAAAMTVLGKENISYLELRARLKDAIADLAKTVEVSTGDNVLSQLMISFFFKGGHEELGCEFLHKSFREYLFAEGVVETLKQYGRLRVSLPERAPYWKDFDESDPRHAFVRALASQVASQWLTPEVVANLERLIAWEIERSTGNAGPSLKGSQPTAAITLDEWAATRDGLNDLWDWWAEGVHLRPQTSLTPRLDVDFKKPYAQELVELAVPIDMKRGTIPEPRRMIVADSVLGDALFRLNVWTHFYVARAQGWLEGEPSPSVLWANVSEIGKGPRRHQTSVSRERMWTLFAPYGKSSKFWENYVARINAAGWRLPYGEFPGGCDLLGVDLRGTDLRPSGYGWGCDWSFANLSFVRSLQGGFPDGVFSWTLLQRSVFFLSWLDQCVFKEADLDGAQFNECDLRGARFQSCSAEETQFYASEMIYVRFNDCNLSRAHFVDADLTRSEFSDSNLEQCRIGDGSRLFNTTFQDVEGNLDVNGQLLLIDNKTVLPPNLQGVRLINVDDVPDPTATPSATSS